MKRSNSAVGRASGPPSPDATLARAVARWFKASARPLPWRLSPRDPYLSLVSEFMLQQTQVSRILERFPAFIEAFPDVRALAAAPLDDVLSHWSGLGYYRRAHSLHAAAQAIVTRFGGRVPQGLEDLQTLPGIGRYTAGAIASIVFHQPAPIVDGNVSRILMRIRGKAFIHASPDALAWSWRQADHLVTTAAASRCSPALFNEGLMELGATICTPKNPQCHACPAAAFCTARRRSIQHRIPLPKTAPMKTRCFFESILIINSRGQLLVEQRPSSGMWANLWQAPTWERPDRPATQAEASNWIGMPLIRRTRFTHTTTHRDTRFTVWETSGAIPRAARRNRRFLYPDQVASLALSTPQRRILIEAAP